MNSKISKKNIITKPNILKNKKEKLANLKQSINKVFFTNNNYNNKSIYNIFLTNLNNIKDYKKYIINYINQIKFKSLNNNKVKLIKPIIYSDKPIIEDNKKIYNIRIFTKNNSKYIIMFSLIISKKQNKDKYYKLNIIVKYNNYLFKKYKLTKYKGSGNDDDFSKPQNMLHNIGEYLKSFYTEKYVKPSPLLDDIKPLSSYQFSDSKLPRYLSRDDKISFKCTNTIRERLFRYNTVKENIEKLSEFNCIDYIYENKKYIYTISEKQKNIIYLENTIGSKSANGIIYKAYLKIDGEKTQNIIAVKLASINEENKREHILNNKITHKIILRNKSRHFIMSYMKSFICTDMKKINFLPLQERELATRSKTKGLYIILNERVSGDMNNIMRNKSEFYTKPKMMLNILCQCMLSIAYFHSLDILHCDAHGGNFLYMENEINPNGYYHYIIDGIDLYLEDCGITIALYDFGLVKYKNELNHSDYLYYHKQDYYRILKLATILENEGGYSNFTTPEIPKEKVLEIYNFLKYHRSDLNDLNVIRYLYKELFESVLIKKLPKNSCILNNEPYLLYYK